MKLPHATDAVIPQAKLVDYLLSDTHPVGKAKAIVFQKYGYHLDNVDQLAEALIRVAVEEDVDDIVSFTYGVKCVIEGVLPTPDGRSINIRTVWMIDHERYAPRFVTAYPRQRWKRG